MDVRILVRRVRRELRNEDQQKVQKLRDNLVPLMAELVRLQGAAGITNTGAPVRWTSEEDIADWDDQEPVNATDNVSDLGPAPALYQAEELPPHVVLIEDQIICLPSNGNIGQCYNTQEIVVRKTQANRQLDRLRELIAEKSFQYSDIMRNAPRKAARTRSRAAVKHITDQITFHAFVYRNCRSRMISMGADIATLQQFCELTRDNLKASTAVLKPNIPGASTLRLSWIWHSVNKRLIHTATADADSATLMECKS